MKVHYRIVEGNSERIQVYEGIVIAMDNKGMSKTFTVRKLSFDVGVERIFPVYTTRIAKIDVIRKGKARALEALLPQGEDGQVREAPRKEYQRIEETFGHRGRRARHDAAEPAAAESTPQQ